MTTRIFLTTLFSLAILASAMALDIKPTNDQKTTIILLPLFESTDKTIEGDARYAELLAEMFKSKQISNIYSNGADDLNTILQPMSSQKSLMIQTLDETNLSQALFELYKAESGQTIVLAADAKTLVKALNMLSGRDEFTKIRSNDRYKVYQLESTQLGKGNIRSFDLTKQVKAAL